MLIHHYHDAIDAADDELDSLELEDGAVAAEHWSVRVITRMGEEAHELREVLDALAALEPVELATCRVCGALLPTLVASGTRCGDCAITLVMPSIGSASPA